MASTQKKERVRFDRRKTAGLLLGRLKNQGPYLFLWILVIAFGIGLDAVLYWMVKVFTDDVLMREDLKENFTDAIIVIGYIAAVFTGQGIQKGLQLYYTNRVGQYLILDLRRAIFDHLQTLSLDFFESQKTGSIMSWLTTDVLRIREFAGKQLPTLFRGIPAIIVFFTMMVITSPTLMIAGFLLIPLIVAVVQIAGRKIRGAALRVQESLADVSGELQEGISAIEVVRSFANEAYEILKFGRVNTGVYKAEMKRATIEAVMVPLLSLAAALGLGLILAFGLWQVGEGWITAGQFIMIIALLHKTNDEATRLGRTWMAFQDTLAASDRIFAFLDIAPTIKDPPDAIDLEKCDGLIEFEDVTFAYDGTEYVLKNIDVKADPGAVIAFVGPSGAGKSSLGKLIPRFYETVSGEVKIDGHNIRELNLTSLRKYIGIVPQETVLFHGTVRENIAYGKLDATNDEIVEAAKSANAHGFINGFQHGYETVVGERGTRLSGGQRQRISIARAILKDPKILILDEATSNLDTESEKIVQLALEGLMQGRTTFIIAHRLSTIRNATEIIVLKNGEIVDRGTHDELMSRPGTYRELYEVEEMGET